MHYALHNCYALCITYKHYPFCITHYVETITHNEFCNNHYGLCMTVCALYHVVFFIYEMHINYGKLMKDLP